MATSTNKTSLLRLPLELCWKIYAIIRGPRRFVDVTKTRFELNPWLKTQIYRPDSEKGCICMIQNRNRYVRRPEGFIDTVRGVMLYDSYITEHRRTCSRRFDWRTGILTVSKDISADVLDYLYRDHTFLVNIHDNGHLNLAKLSVRNLQRIRRVRVVARSMGTTYGHQPLAKPLALDDQLWQPLLNDLPHFCIVAQQPLKYDNDPHSKREMRDWINWLDPILQYFSASLSPSTAIQLDADGRAETVGLMEKHFAGRYQQITTIEGDKCFDRSRWSGKSGYWNSHGREDDEGDWSD